MNLYKVEMDAWYTTSDEEDDINVEHELNVLAKTAEQAIEKAKKFPSKTVPVDTYHKDASGKTADKAKLKCVELVSVYKDLEIDIE